MKTISNYQDENTSGLNRHQRRMFKAAKRKNKPFNPYESLKAYNPNKIKDLKAVESMIVSGAGK